MLMMARVNGKYNLDFSANDLSHLELVYQYCDLIKAEIRLIISKKRLENKKDITEEYVS